MDDGMVLPVHHLVEDWIDFLNYEEVHDFEEGVDHCDGDREAAWCRDFVVRALGPHLLGVRQSGREVLTNSLGQT